jgi:hypothetical protein
MRENNRVMGLQLPHFKGTKRTGAHKYRRPTSPSQKILFLLHLNTVHSAGEFYRIHENSKQETDINRYKQIQTDTDRYKQIQTNTNRYKQI